MFTPRELQLERGWPGIIEGDTVVQLAAQTLQAFFTQSIFIKYKSNVKGRNNGSIQSLDLIGNKSLFT